MRLDVKHEYIKKLPKEEALRKIFELLMEHEHRLDELEKKPNKKITKREFIELLKTK